MKLRAICVALVAAGSVGCGDDEEVVVVTTGAALVRTDLVGDQSGASLVDPKLINGWGLAFGPTGTAWVVANGTGYALVYDVVDGQITPAIPPVALPGPGGVGTSAPTGEAFNGDSASFNGDVFLFATEDGTILGWRGTTASQAAVLEVDLSAQSDHPVYKGLTIGTMNGAPRLYAADFHNRKIDVFDGNFVPVGLTDAFVDADLPADYAPFNVYAYGDRVYVAYAKQEADSDEDVPGAGNGFVDSYNLDGRDRLRLISDGALNAPWGMAIAPADFGTAGGTLLVGNFGDGKIHAFNVTTGAMTTTFTGTGGADLAIDGLWALEFRTAPDGTNRLYFTAGPNEETHGVFGVLAVASTAQVTTTP